VRPVLPGRRRGVLTRIRLYLQDLGPGLIAGGSDNDPTTVATMAVAGATTGFALSWLVVLVYPMLAAVQIIAAQVGAASRAGLLELVLRVFGRGWGWLLLISILPVNLITIGADLRAGADALSLLVQLPSAWLALPYAAILLGLLLLGSYDEVERVLKYVLLVFMAYAVSTFLARPNWAAVVAATVHPRVTGSQAYVQAALAILGTTLTSYAFVWQEQEEAEEPKPRSRRNLLQVDAALGMLAAVVVFWFILIGTGATLGARHQQIQTAQEAAGALRPLAGPYASYLFSVGLLGSSFIAVPVLALTTAYVICQQLGYRQGLSRAPREAKAFYLFVALSLLLGAAVSFAGIPSISLLFLASIVGGIATPVGLVFLMLVAHHVRPMDGRRTKPVVMALGWATTVAVTAVDLYFLWQRFGPGHP
jgi:Mn2+/Fe2+ NRAMP family transporter